MSDIRPETPESINKAENSNVARPSEKGIKSIQGDYNSTGPLNRHGNDTIPPGHHALEGLSLTNLDSGSVKKVYPKDLLQETPPLNNSAANDLQLAMQHAESTKATRSHTSNPEGVPPEYWRMRSEISEHIAQENMPDSLRTDKLSDNGSNFPGYDVINKNEISSVKVFSLTPAPHDGQVVLEPRYGEYRKEFKDIISPDSNQNQNAAQKIWAVRDKGEWNDIKDRIPPEIALANSPGEVAKAISNCSTMRIPEDQLENVRSDLMERFNLSREEVCSRVKSIDKRFTTAHYQSKAAEVWMKREQEFVTLQKRLHE